MKSAFVVAFIGLSEGVVVGTALAAFLTILDIIPRLAQLTNTEHKIKIYEVMIALSVTLISLLHFLEVNIVLGKITVAMIGLLMGMFIGLLASALTEVTNVIPVIVNRFKLHDHVKYLFIALASGKIIGSLVFWLAMKE
ncbi:stage V sporulation protein AB [Clostridiaceae bacterium 35-E11]